MNPISIPMVLVKVSCVVTRLELQRQIHAAVTIEETILNVVWDMAQSEPRFNLSLNWISNSLLCLYSNYSELERHSYRMRAIFLHYKNVGLMKYVLKNSSNN